ncbi:MAG: hypothetical protein B7X11_06520, partial [Acidobacteria bacterium 37-65-4]
GRRRHRLAQRLDRLAGLLQPFARQPQPERVGGQLVRDPQCGTYVPESSAITVTREGETLHFCSDTCRDAYAAAHA